MYNDRRLYRVSYQMTEEIYQEANRLLYRKRMPGICLAILGVGIIGLIPDIVDGIMTGTDILDIIAEAVFVLLLLLCLAFAALFLAMKVFMKRAVSSSYKTYIGLSGRRHSVFFYEDKVVYQSENSQAEYHYEKFWKMIGNKKVVIMLTGSRWQPGMIILPENGLWEKRDERMEKFLRVKCINVKRGIEHL